MHPLLDIEAICLRSVSNIFYFIFQNIWCIQKGCLPLHPLLEIGATSLDNELDLFKNNFKKHLVHSKKGFTFAPAFRDKQLSAMSNNDLLKTYIHVYN